MDDKLTPIEAEVLEYSSEPDGEGFLPVDFYGTATPPRQKKNYVALWICLGLAIIAICTLGVASAVLSVRFQRGEDGSWTLSMGPARMQTEEEQVKNLFSGVSENSRRSVDQASGSQFHLQLDSARSPAALSADALYASASSGVVCLEITTTYGTLTYTGVVLSADGYILSATDSLSGAVSVLVHFSDGTELSASMVGEEKYTGVCLLKVEAERLTPARFASSDNLPVGSSVYCIANPYGTVLPNVLSDGLLSAKQVVQLENESFCLLQTSAELQNSGYGCPVYDSAGRVVGITTAVGRYLVSGSDPCFAVSSADLQRIVAAFSSGENNRDHWLGLTVEEIPERYRFLYNYPGVLWLTDVSKESGFYNVLYPYDVITAVNGSAVSGLEAFNAVIEACEPGQTVRLTIFRSGKFYYADLKVLER